MITSSIIEAFPVTVILYPSSLYINEACPERSPVYDLKIPSLSPIVVVSPTSLELSINERFTSIVILSPATFLRTTVCEDEFELVEEELSKVSYPFQKILEGEIKIVNGTFKDVK